MGGGTIARGYPTIIEEAGLNGTTAALRVLADSALSRASHARGVRRLLLAECALQDKRITTRWTGAQALALAASPYRNTAALVADLQLAAVTALTTPDSPGLPHLGSPDAGAVRDADSYAAALTHVRLHLEDDVFAMVARVIAALDASRELDAAVRRTTSLSLLATLTEVRALAADLVGEGFIARTPAARLKDLPRYLRAATHRIAKAQENPSRDAELAWRVREVGAEVDLARQTARANGPDPEAAERLERARWLVEEFRVSLFAQQLGTSEPVSERRIRAVLG
jgi:ATP-dependent helicase HrpA